MATDTRNIGDKKSILEQTTAGMLSSGLSTKKQTNDNTIVKSSDGSPVITDPSKIKPKNIADIAKESNKSSGEGSFIKLNEKQKDQIQASYDRSNMRQAARLLKNTGEIGTIKSEYADEKNIGRLDLKNIKAQDRINKRLESSRNRLDKKILKRTGDASLTYRNRSAKQAANEERFSNIAKQLPKPIDLSKSVKDIRLLIDQPIKKEFFNKGKIVDGVSIGRGFDKSTVSSSSFNRAGKYNTSESFKFKESEKPGKPVFNYSNTKNYTSGQDAETGIKNISFNINKYK